MEKVTREGDGRIVYQTMSFPLCSRNFSEYCGWFELHNEIHTFGCDGLEGIWGGEDFPVDMPKALIVDYRLHQFLSGACMERNRGALPSDLPKNHVERGGRFHA